jgi:lysozyme
MVKLFEPADLGNTGVFTQRKVATTIADPSAGAAELAASRAQLQARQSEVAAERAETQALGTMFNTAASAGGTIAGAITDIRSQQVRSQADAEINDLTQQFLSSKDPNLLTEEASRDPSVQQANREFNALVNAKNQGILPSEAFKIRLETKMRSLITQNPGFEKEIRALAKAKTGFDPIGQTVLSSLQAQDRLVLEQQKLAAKQQETAAKLGFDISVPEDAKKFDQFQQTVALGERQKQERQARINTAQSSADEIHLHSVNRWGETSQDIIASVYEPSSGLVDQNGKITNIGSIEQRMNISMITEINQVRRELTQQKVPVETIDKITDNLRSDMEAEAKIILEGFKNNTAQQFQADTAKYMKDGLVIAGTKTAPQLMLAKQILGEQGLSTLMQKITTTSPAALERQAAINPLLGESLRVMSQLGLASNTLAVATKGALPNRPMPETKAEKQNVINTLHPIVNESSVPGEVANNTFEWMAQEMGTVKAMQAFQNPTVVEKSPELRQKFKNTFTKEAADAITSLSQEMSQVTTNLKTLTYDAASNRVTISGPQAGEQTGLVGQVVPQDQALANEAVMKVNALLKIAEKHTGTLGINELSQIGQGYVNQVNKLVKDLLPEEAPASPSQEASSANLGLVGGIPKDASVLAAGGIEEEEEEELMDIVGERSTVIQPSIPSDTVKFTDSDHFNTQIQNDEGLSLTPYKDTKGIMTIGVGFNLEDSTSTRKMKAIGMSDRQIKALRAGKGAITEEQSRALVASSINTATQDARALVSNFDEHPQELQEVLVNMSFQLGRSRLRGFKKFRKAMEKRDYFTASKEMLDSKWATQDSPARAQRLADLMAAHGSPEELVGKDTGDSVTLDDGLYQGPDGRKVLVRNNHIVN